LRIDGDRGFGHYIGHIAIDHAVEQASESGVSVVAVHGSNHFGVGAYFVERAARRQMLCIATSNSIAKVAPTGGAVPVFGTNPFAFGVPRENADPVILDMATSATSGGSIIMARERQEQLPEGVVVDRDGRFITDPLLADQGVLLPFGGPKGSGLAFMVEVLSGVVAGAVLSHKVRSMFNDFSGNGDNGHCFIVIDPSRFVPLKQYYGELERLIALMKSSAVSPGSTVFLPGERRWHIMRQHLRSGIPIDPELADVLLGLAAETKIEPPTGLAQN
jgi:LDH2 family malate/lactate/ureidoglycolate dehydrogenase